MTSARLVATDGTSIPLRMARFHGEPSAGEQRVLDALRDTAAAVLDVGCGPGRHTAELAARGHVVLGVDTSPAALALAVSRGAPVLRRSIFDPLPGAGRWNAALLFDGNIGIGGDPVTLLRRIAALLEPGGRTVIEIDRPGRPMRRLTVRLCEGHVRSAPFPWAVVGVDAIAVVAAAAGFDVDETVEVEDRWFAWVVRR